MRRGRVVLIGEMGVGKTTVGRALAESLGWGFFDSDLWIEDVAGRTGAEIARSEGVAALHHLELEALHAGLANPSPTVIASAASVADTEAGQEALLDMKLVWLDAAENVLAERRRAGSHRRSQKDEERERTSKHRHEIWRGLAGLRLGTSDLSADEAVAEILAWMRGAGGARPEEM